MKNKKYRLALWWQIVGLLMAIPLGPAAAQEPEHPVKWYEGFKIHYVHDEYNNPPKSLEDIRKLLNSKWPDTFSLYKNLYSDNRQKIEAGSCAEFLEAKKQQLAIRGPDVGPLTTFAAYCKAAQMILDAIPAKSSNISGIPLDRRLVNYMPPEVVYHIAVSEPRPAGKNWAEAEGGLKFLGMEHGQIWYESDSAQHYIAPIAKGDFNKDGMEDLLAIIFHKVKEGTHVSVTLYLFTRHADSLLTRIYNFITGNSNSGLLTVVSRWSFYE